MSRSRRRPASPEQLRGEWLDHEFTGLAVCNPNTSPPRLTIEVTGASATGKFAFVLNLQSS
jgi:hypothetical protein